MNAKQIFEACIDNDAPLDVLNVCGCAADNAASTINENGGKFVHGHFTEEFFKFWMLTVEGILSSGEVSPDAIEWFKSHGVTA